MTSAHDGLDQNSIREAIAASLPAAASAHLPDQPLYLPWPHQRALRQDCSLVVGATGVGKSVLANALLSGPQTQFGASLARDLGTSQPTAVAGFSDQAQSSHPDPETFARLMRDGPDSHGIWLAIICRALAASASAQLPVDTWQHTVDWVRFNHEEPLALLQAADTALAAEGRTLLVVFDALDRVSPAGNWEEVTFAIRSLLQLSLQLNPFRQIHFKIFLRTDQYERGRWSDLSNIARISANRVELSWSPTDLHALLWHQLCHGPPSPVRDGFRAWCREADAAAAGWELPLPVQQDESVQQQLFERLAGRKLGDGSRRGVPYRWIVYHLADALGATSPRSFLAAIRRAAVATRQGDPAAEPLLSYDGLRLGAYTAAAVRIAELAEDYPWLPELMQPFAGNFFVPFIEEIFEHKLLDAFGSIPEGVPHLAASLPKEFRHQGAYGLMDYMAELGLFTKMDNHRVNIPEIYRIGFNLGRRGGIKPVLRTMSTPV